MAAVVESTPPQQTKKAAADASDANKADGEVAPNTGSSSSGDRPFNVYVKNFTADLDDDKLRALFKEFGTIQSCTVLLDHNGKSKQVGFVQFSSDEEAKKAVEEMHSKTGHGPKPLHVALTSKKPANNKKRYSWGFYDYQGYNYSQYSPTPQYGSYATSPYSTSPDSSLSPPQSHGSPHQMYPSGIPAWSGAGPVQIVFVPCPPQAFDRPARGVPSYQSASQNYIDSNKAAAARPPADQTPAPKTPAYRTPAQRNRAYNTPAHKTQGGMMYKGGNHYGHPHGNYMMSGSPGYGPYYSYNNNSGNYYGGYGSGWGSPYYPQYANQAASPNGNYGYN